MQPVRALQSTGKSKACFTWHYAFVKNSFRSLDTSKLDARRRLIDSFVNAVTIFDDYILITFNYKEGETRIDFTDIESSDLQSVGGATATAAIHTEAKDSDDIIAAINVAFANTVSKLPALPEAYRV